MPLILSHLWALTGLWALLNATFPLGSHQDTVRRHPKCMLGYPSALGTAGSLVSLQPSLLCLFMDSGSGKGGQGGLYPFSPPDSAGGLQCKLPGTWDAGSRSQPGDAG